MTKYWAKKIRNIVLTGMPASGKTSFGKTYAFFSGRLFIDLDRAVESMAGKSIADIYKQDGEDAFRALESKALQKMEHRHSSVIAMGGGTLAQEENWAIANRLGLVVTLSASLDSLANRLWQQKNNQNHAVRPLFAHCKNKEMISRKLSELWEHREGFYQRSDFILDTDFSTIDTLKLQLSCIEKKAMNRVYLKEIHEIMTDTL